MAYKFKPRKSVTKRFRVSGTGKLKHIRSKRRHLLSGRSYERIYTFLDNDPEGKKAAARFTRHFGDAVCLCNRIYAGYKDYNEYLASR